MHGPVPSNGKHMFCWLVGLLPAGDWLLRNRLGFNCKSDLNLPHVSHSGRSSSQDILFSWQITGAQGDEPNYGMTSQVFAHISLAKASHMTKPKANRVGIYIPPPLLGGIFKVP